jgi:hypothetical protein
MTWLARLEGHHPTAVAAGLCMGLCMPPNGLGFNLGRRRFSMPGVATVPDAENPTL